MTSFSFHAQVAAEAIENLAKYLNLALAEACDRRMADIPTRKLPAAARQSRQHANARRPSE